MKSNLLFLLPLLLLAACSSDPVPVVVNKADLSKGTILVDGKDQHRFKDSAIRLELTPGKHQLALDGGKPDDFYVTDKGGLLNLDGEEYVAFDIEYSDPKAEGMTIQNAGPIAMVLIDSVIVLKRRNAETPMPPDSFFARHIPKLLAAPNGNYVPVVYGMNKGYDSSETVIGIKKFGKGKRYINKFWDFDLDSEIPETLDVAVSKNRSTFVKDSRTKVAIVRAGLFLMLAMTDPDNYFTWDMRRAKDLGKAAAE